MEVEVNEKASHAKGRIAVICGSLGHLSDGEYLIEPDCLEGLKELIRLLKRDDGTHTNRRCLGEVNVVRNHLIHIIKKCPPDSEDLFQIALRLLINVTTPAMLLYCEEIPREKLDRHYYLTLVGHDQSYKLAFSDVEFWNKVSSRLTNLFEMDWAERSTENGIEIERILTLLRNVLHIPGDAEDDGRPDNEETAHDKVLLALRQSQILELLLLVASSKNEEPYYLNLLEIFSLLLRELNPGMLARCDGERSETERIRETEELTRACESKKKSQKNYSNLRSFRSTFVLRGAKTISNVDKVCHKSLISLKRLDFGENKIPSRPNRNRIPVESERPERRSTLSVRLFLKEFCSEFLNGGFDRFMAAVKNRLVSGKSLAHDQTYYFWAVSFFLRFAVGANANFDLIKNCLSPELFHFVQTNAESAFDHLKTEKKESANWARRIHAILKAYQSLLETLLWMDSSKSPLVRSVSREIKSNIFYVVEYREMTLNLLLGHEPTSFSVSYLRDLVQTTHLFVKLLEDYSKQTKLVVQKVEKKRRKSKKRRREKMADGEKKMAEVESARVKWERISSDVYDCLLFGTAFPEIPPFDAALDIPIDDQKDRAMRRIQKLLHGGNVMDAVGLLRSSRQVWPENDYFGREGMAAEEETTALREICLADLGEIDSKGKSEPEETEVSEEEEEEGVGSRIVEQDFDLMEFKKRLVHKRVVESCGILLKNYRKNSDQANHCAVKMLHRIGWECCMPAMLYQGSLFCTLLAIMNERDSKRYEEINTFAVNLMRKFRKHAAVKPVVFLELLFWKDRRIALEIQHGYEEYEDEKRAKTSRRKKSKTKCDGGHDADDEDGNEADAIPKKKKNRTGKKKERAEESEKGKRRSRKGSKAVDEGEKAEESDVAEVCGGKENGGVGRTEKTPDESEERSETGTDDEDSDGGIGRPESEKTPGSDSLSDDVEEDRRIGRSEPFFSAEPAEKKESPKIKDGGRLSNDHDGEEIRPCQSVKKSKRIRCISSDSDDFQWEAGEDAMVAPGKRRRSAAVIDSDSEDFDTDNSRK